VHPRGARHVVDPTRLRRRDRRDLRRGAHRRIYGEVIPVSPQRMIETPDGATLRWQGREFLFLDAPGHARHHVVVRDSASGHFFAGDTFGLSYRSLTSVQGSSRFPRRARCSSILWRCTPRSIA
jgi:glyoxylase-like metal-dependent hydrolase (beta-lactamase superfamily II)